MSRSYDDITFHMTQALSGHDCFSLYLHRFEKSVSPACVFCGYGNDNAKYTLFSCDAWHVMKRRIGILVASELNSTNMVDLMLASKDNWDAISSFITTVLKKKEEEKRVQQMAERNAITIT